MTTHWPQWEGKCSFCDSTEFGGTFTFEGHGVVEQPIAVDLCMDHWPNFWKDITKSGWVPPNDDDVRLVTMVPGDFFEKGLDTDSED